MIINTNSNALISESNPTYIWTDYNTIRQDIESIDYKTIDYDTFGHNLKTLITKNQHTRHYTTSKRKYRKPWIRKDILNHIRERDAVHETMIKTNKLINSIVDKYATSC